MTKPVTEKMKDSGDVWPWVFQMDAWRNITLFTIPSPGRMIPVLHFTPEAFLAFQVDVSKSAESFIPQALRDAIKVIEEYDGTP